MRTIWRWRSKPSGDVNPFEVEMVGTPLTGSGSFQVWRMAAVPESIPLITGDAAHNIRSALDHLAWSAVPLPQRRRQTCFPVWTNAGGPHRQSGEIKYLASYRALRLSLSRR
jgi:hypothetical protein